MMLGNGAVVVRDSVCSGWTGGERKTRGTLELLSSSGGLASRVTVTLIKTIKRRNNSKEYKQGI